MANKLGKKVLFVATEEALDEEMKARIEEHQKARPPYWRTLELSKAVGKGVEAQIGDAQVVIVDCLTLLVSNLLTNQIDYGQTEAQVTAEIDGLINCVDRVKANFIIVSNEVGTGIVPENKLARFYRDLLGKVNQLMAARADEVYLLVSGLPVQVKSSRSQTS